LTSIPDEKSDLTDVIVHAEIKTLFEERYQVVKADLIKYRTQWSNLTGNTSSAKLF